MTNATEDIISAVRELAIADAELQAAEEQLRGAKSTYWLAQAALKSLMMKVGLTGKLVSIRDLDLMVHWKTVEDGQLVPVILNPDVGL